MIKTKEEVTTQTQEQVVELSPEEKQEIGRLQDAYSKCIYDVGELQLRRMNVEKQLTALDKELSNKYEEILSYQNVEKELLKKLDDKYGLENLGI